MVQVSFLFEGQTINIQCTKNELYKEIIKKFEIKGNIKSESVYFLYNGNRLNEEMKLEEIIGNNNINNINIIVNSINEIKNNNIINNKYFKCPECKENIRMKIKDYKIELYDCKNNHYIDNILLEEYENTQKMDISKIIYNICNKNNKSYTYKNGFYICNTCKINICPLCKSNHDKNHNIINYDQKEYICEIHNENYIKYCIHAKKIYVCYVLINMINIILFYMIILFQI